MYRYLSSKLPIPESWMKSAHCPGVPGGNLRFTHWCQAGDPAECFNASFRGTEQHDAGQCLGYCKVGNRSGPKLMIYQRMVWVVVSFKEESLVTPMQLWTGLMFEGFSDGWHHLMWPTRPQDWPRKDMQLNIIHKELCLCVFDFSRPGWKVIFVHKEFARTDAGLCTHCLDFNFQTQDLSGLRIYVKFELYNSDLSGNDGLS